MILIVSRNRCSEQLGKITSTIQVTRSLPCPLLPLMNKPQSLQQYFAPCPRGLEPVLITELEAAGYGDRGGSGRGALPGGLVDLLPREPPQPGRHAGPLAGGARAVSRGAGYLPAGIRDARPEWFDPHRTIRVYVTAIQSPLRSLEYITVHIKDAVVTRFLDDLGERPSVDTELPDVRIHAFFDADNVTLYLDTSGEPLFKRGFRRSTNEAPLKENLARGHPAALRLGRRDAAAGPDVRQWDDPAGGGADGAEDPAGKQAAVRIEKLKLHQPKLWSSIREAARRAQQPVHPLPMTAATSTTGRWRPRGATYKTPASRAP